MARMMHFKFKDQQFQDDAVRAVCDVFEGQPCQIRQYLIDPGLVVNKNSPRQMSIAAAIERNGYANSEIALSDDELLKNTRAIQAHNYILPSNSLERLARVPAFTVEMETGTGKTFTYIKTMYELNARYGWSKFIVVVPSISIREGVNKSFQMTADYFKAQYGKGIRYFIYHSNHLNALEQYASDSGINVMIINSQAFNRDITEKSAESVEENERSGKATRNSLRIFARTDSFRSRRPIDVIAATHPIIIIDEPQSVLGADKKNKTRQNIRLFNPLFFIGYSATHREKFNMLYRLDAVDAYRQKLVKKIAVKGISITGRTATDGYIYVQKINRYPNKNPDATVTFEMDIRGSGLPQRVTKKLSRNDNLYAISGELEEYRDGYVISEIDAGRGIVRFVNGKELSEGQVTGDADNSSLRRIQIRETIVSHLEKERQLYRQGIKVLSLFFIDEVAKYKSYDDDGNEVPGEYWKIFEDEYKKAVDRINSELPFAEDEVYRKYLERWRPSDVHSGYFSIDKKGRAVNSKVGRGETESSDESAYDLIMHDKERLLSFDEPTRFIFSHSALREGWDNPNIFQICTLREAHSEISKRQEIGRGLRLCVDQNGRRMDVQELGDRVQEVNQLVVVANESYEDFARGLQSEMNEVTKDRPRKVSANLFNGRNMTTDDGRQISISSSDASRLYSALAYDGIIDSDDQPTEDFLCKSSDEQVMLIDNVLKGNKLISATEMAHCARDVQRLISTVYDPSKFNILDDARKRETLHVNRRQYDSKAFQNLWKQINEKSYYTVDFNDDLLIKNCVDSIDRNLTVTQTMVTVTTGLLESMGENEVDMRKHVGQRLPLSEIATVNVKYDLIGEIAEHTGLTRRVCYEILKRISKFDLFKRNPEEFIANVSKLINDQKASTVVEHVKYSPTDDRWDAEEIFIDNEISGIRDKDIVRTGAKNLYDGLKYDSDVEKRLAEEMDSSNDVEVYVKLPRSFYIDTPMGKYNPDWAIAFKEGSVKHIYFVAETKGSNMEIDLRPVERSKIACARKHFEAISGKSVKYEVVSSYEDLYKKITSD